MDVDVEDAGMKRWRDEEMEGCRSDLLSAEEKTSQGQ